MATKDDSKSVTVTVGDLFAAVVDVVGDQVDQVVDLLRFDDMKGRAHIIIDGPAAAPRKDSN